MMPNPHLCTMMATGSQVGASIGSPLGDWCLGDSVTKSPAAHKTGGLCHYDMKYSVECSVEVSKCDSSIPGLCDMPLCTAVWTMEEETHAIISGDSEGSGSE